MSGPIQIAYILGFPIFQYESRALKSAAYDVSGRLTNILTVPGNAELDDGYFSKNKDVWYIYLVICNAIVTFILEFPGTSNLNASATTLTFIFAVLGTSNLNVEKSLNFVLAV